MNLKIQTLHIERFRSLRDLHIQGLGRVNLITGRNNTGKSTVLEALRLLTADSLPVAIASILRFREEDVAEEDSTQRGGPAEKHYSMSSLFYDFPEFSGSIPPLIISSHGAAQPMRLSIRPVWLSEETEEDGLVRLIPLQESLFAEETADLIPGIVIDTGSKPRSMALSLFQRRSFMQTRNPAAAIRGESRFPCVFVSPYAGEKTAALGTLWDAIALSDLEQEVVEALRIIDPNISAVSMVGGESARASRRAIVRAQGRARPVALRSYGDGLNRLFGIILSLANARGGLLLIDEFENGMHHSVQVDVWRTVFRLARRLDIQVVATSHSWDCIEAFQAAAAEDPEEGVLVRLTRKGEDIIPTIFREKELAVVARDRIEVR